MAPQNNQIWLMTSAFKGQPLEMVMDEIERTGAQGAELCVFQRKGGTRKDHTATHVDYESFGPVEAHRLVDMWNRGGLQGFSVGAYENLIGGPKDKRVSNQNHLLRLIRIAHLLGGNANDVKVGTFVGWNNQMGVRDNGFERNLKEWERVFKPIIKYAEGLGVTILYENCPMEGWRPKTAPTTLNNLPATLGARKLMYALNPSRAHGETLDPSHDVWQGVDPSKVVRASDMRRIHRVHVKSTYNKDNADVTYWGRTFPMPAVDEKLAKKAGVPIAHHEWNRHPYEPTLPGFGGGDSMDWRAFVGALNERGFKGPYVIENEGDNSSHTGNIGATRQGFEATVLNLAPNIWSLRGEQGYSYAPGNKAYVSRTNLPSRDVKKVTMRDLGVRN